MWMTSLRRKGLAATWLMLCSLAHHAVPGQWRPLICEHMRLRNFKAGVTSP